MERVAERKPEAVCKGAPRHPHAVRRAAEHMGRRQADGDERARSNRQSRGQPAHDQACPVRAGRRDRGGRLAAPIDAQDDRAAGREIVKKWQSAIVNVRVVLKMRVSVGGREMQSMDESVETVGTVIDPSGLTVLSLGALNPGAMMNKMMGGGGSGQERMEFGSEPSDVKLRLADGKELPRASSCATRISTSRSCGPPPSRTSRSSRSISQTKDVRRCSTRSWCCRGSAASADGRPRRRCRPSARSSSGRGRST